MSSSAVVTRLLLDWSAGDARARDEMLPLVFDELRKIARGYLARERPDHTLEATALVHEVYLRLIDQRRVDWKNRAQFMGVAAVIMRQILMNHARGHGAKKRGGEARRVSLTVAQEIGPTPDVDLIVLNDALDRLEALDPRKSRIVELKFFGGLTTSEIGGVLQISVATVEREWSFSRAWLYDAIGGMST
jgi:RNA polymerase sigma factor (TIGR02999 family)